jgi:hypothetical protein
MTPALEALTRRAVACRGWRWMQGMLIADNGAGVRFLWEDDRYLHGMAAEASGLWMRMNKDRERLPDLTDPATLGCLLALVREAWGDPYLIATKERGSCWIIAIHLCDAMLVGGRYIRGATEIEALIAALEAAP